MSGPNTDYDPVEVTPLKSEEVEAMREAALAAVAAAADLDALKQVRLDHAGDRSPLALANRSDSPVQLMLMQGMPLGEPVIRSTVYVTNTIEELHQAKRDFQRTGFGGWPWDTRQPMHGPGFARFAQYADTGEREAPRSL